MKDQDRERELMADATDVADLVKELGELAEVQRRLTLLKKREAELKESIRAGIGDASGGVVAGRLVVSNAPTARFATVAFAKDNPSLAEQYMVERVVREIDVDALVRERPELAAKYRARSMRLDEGALALAVDDLSERATELARARLQDAHRAAQEAAGASTVAAWPNPTDWVSGGPQGPAGGTAWPLPTRTSGVAAQSALRWGSR